MKIKSYPLPHFNDRPKNTLIDTVVIHSMYAKGYRHKTHSLNCFEVLNLSEVSSHYSIDRSGTIWQHVEESHRAWHAGKSILPALKNSTSRENVNDFSIGIEVIGVFGQRFKARQYRALNNLLAAIISRHPIQAVVGHRAIAPERKVDPGPSFKWNKIRLVKRQIQIIS